MPMGAVTWQVHPPMETTAPAARGSEGSGPCDETEGCGTDLHLGSGSAEGKFTDDGHRDAET